MKVITVTLTLQVNDTAAVEDIINDINVDFNWGYIEEIINIHGEFEREVSNEKDD